jgi:hypothetical protein
MAKLGGFFGPHSGALRIFLGIFDVGSGTFGTFSDFNASFAGSYSALGQHGTFTLGVALTDQNPTSTSGPCTLTLNDKTDNAATYQTNGSKITITTTLNATPLDVYPSQSGTQIDNVSNHNVWVGP